MLPANLVLNINTPKYFKNISKRPANSICATIQAKKPKLALGKSLRVASKNSTKKISSLDNLSQNYRFKNAIRSPITALSESRTSFLSQPISNNVNVEESFSFQKSKVTFNSEVQYFSTESKNNLVGPNINARAFNDGKIHIKDTQGKNVTSSLFSRKPHIPEIPRPMLNVKLTTQEVFSSKSFNDLDIAPQIISNIEKFGYTYMTKVQQLAIPPILEGKDALIKSQTGSGKTMSYALPIIHKLMTRIPKVDRSQGTFALIVVPTRELAIQTYQWMERLCKTCVWVVPGYLIGGEKKKAEKSRIRKGINILVATPGRLTDHINNTNCLSLLHVQYLVLDEADRMLEMGYEKSIKSIIFALNKQKQETSSVQTIMLSATLTSAVEKLAGISMISPEVINISNCDLSITGNLSSESLVTPQNLTHFYMLVPPKLRLVTLASFILEKCKLSSEKKMLIFMSTQDMVDYHTSLFSMKLSSYGQKKYSSLQKKVDKVLVRTQNRKKRQREEEYSYDESDEDNQIDEVNEKDIHFFKLHGNMSQPERTAVFKSFCDSKYGVLLCTDVASRGLDLPKLNWIVQYTPAGGASDYVHRVGRTARGNLKGSAVIFINPTESTYVTMLEKHGIKFSEMRMEKVLSSLINPSLYESEDPPTDMEGAATSLQLDIEHLLTEDKEMYHMATRGFVSFIRSYAAIPREAREFFCFKLLHLGHFAKSFGLRDTPSVLGARGGQNKISGFQSKKRFTVENRKPLLVKRKVISEFDSGFDGIVEEVGKKKAVKKVAKNKKRIATFQTNINKGVNTTSVKSRKGKMVSNTARPKLHNKAKK